VGGREEGGCGSGACGLVVGSELRRVEAGGFVWVGVEGLVERVGDCRGDLGDWVGLAVGEKLAGWRLNVGLETYRKQFF